MQTMSEDGSGGNQTGEGGVSHMIKNLKTWLRISGFVVGNWAIEGFIAGDDHV